MDQFEKMLDEAIDKDEINFRQATEPDPDPARAGPRQIQVFSINDPEREEAKVVIDVDNSYSKYSQLRCRLMNERLILKRGELWIRHEDREKNPLTPNGRYWERAKPTSDIDETKEVLKIDVLELENTNPYMVALLYDERKKEIPVPLEIAIGGSDCCVPNCGDLRRHLQKLWDTKVVVDARRLPGCECVFTHPLNDDTFDRDVTELFVRCKSTPRM